MIQTPHLIAFNFAQEKKKDLKDRTEGTYNQPLNIVIVFKERYNLKRTVKVGANKIVN